MEKVVYAHACGPAGMRACFFDSKQMHGYVHGNLGGCVHVALMANKIYPQKLPHLPGKAEEEHILCNFISLRTVTHCTGFLPPIAKPAVGDDDA